MQQLKPLEILVFGFGCIGSIFGSRVQGTRARVTAVCRSNYDITKSRGVEVRSKLWGNNIFRPSRIVRSPSEVADVPYDFVVLALKESPEYALRTLRPVVKDHTTLVSAQNGVTSELALRRCGFDNPILSATCYISCRQPTPGVVEQISHVKSHAFYFGKHSRGRSGEGDRELDALVSLDHSFAKAENAQKQRWEKMVFNAAWNLSSALFEKDTHGLLQDPASMRVTRALAGEAVAVGRALGVSLPSELVDATLTGPANRPSIEPSMLQDLRRNRPLELEAICGDIIGFGRQTGTSTPVMESTYRSLLAVNSAIAGRLNAHQPAYVGRAMVPEQVIQEGVQVLA